MGGRRTVHPGRRESRGQRGAVAQAGEEAAAHEGQLREVSARIEELLAEVFLAGEEAQAPPAPPGGEGPEDAEASSSEGEEVYERCAPAERQRLVERRLEKLLAKLNFEERELALGEVGEWLQDRVSAARQDLNKLGRLDRECADRGAETALAAKAVREDLQRRGQPLVSTVQSFCSALSDMEASKREARRQKAARSRMAYRMSVAPRLASKNTDHGHPPPTTDEELEAAIEELRQRLGQAEAQALEELQELRKAERGRKPGDEDDIADMEHADLYVQQEAMLCYLKEAIRENETRARLIREANDNLHGKVMLGGHGEVIPLSQEAVRIAKALQEEVASDVLPELLALREAEHGEELKQPDEHRLDKINAECQSLYRKLGNMSVLVERFNDSKALEDDLATQLRATDAGELPQSTLLHDCLLALEEGDDDLEDASEADERPEEEPEPPPPEGAERPPQAAAPAGAASREREVRGQALAALQESAKLHEKILDVTENTRFVQVKLKAVEQEDSQAMRVLDILEEHRTLFNGALAVARHQSPASASQPPRAGALAPVPEGGGTEEKRKFRSIASVFSAVANVRRASGLAGGKGQGQGASGPEDVSWTKHFMAEDGGSYAPEALANQAAALKAMYEEEKKLAQECDDLQAALGQKVADLEALSRVKHGGVTPALAGHVGESMTAGLQAIEAFSRCISELQDVTSQPPPQPEIGLTLEERREAVKEALAKKSESADDEGVEAEGGISSEAQTAIQEASQLVDQSSGLLKTLASDAAELGLRRQAMKRRRNSNLKRASQQTTSATNEQESRALRQQTRALVAKRMEIAAAFAQMRKATAQEFDQALAVEGDLPPEQRDSTDEAAAPAGDLPLEQQNSADEAAAPAGNLPLEQQNSADEAAAPASDQPLEQLDSTDEAAAELDAAPADCQSSREAAAELDAAPADCQSSREAAAENGAAREGREFSDEAEYATDLEGQLPETI